jgi:hypothetical protein
MGSKYQTKFLKRPYKSAERRRMQQYYSRREKKNTLKCIWLYICSLINNPAYMGRKTKICVMGDTMIGTLSNYNG